MWDEVRKCKGEHTLGRDAAPDEGEGQLCTSPHETEVEWELEGSYACACLDTNM